MERQPYFEQRYADSPFSVFTVDAQLQVTWANAQALETCPFLMAPNSLQQLTDEPLCGVALRLQQGVPLALPVKGVFFELELYFLPELEDGCLTGALVQCGRRVNASVVHNRHKMLQQMQDFLVESAASAFMTIDGARGKSAGDGCVDDVLSKLYQQNLRLLRFARSCSVYNDLAYGHNACVWENLDLTHLLERLCHRVREIFKRSVHRVALELDLPQSPMITAGDAGMLSRAVTAVIRCVAETSDSVLVRLEKQQDRACIVIGGDTEADLERISPTVEICDGDHLSLTTAWMIVKAHGGSVTVQENEYRLLLPLSAEPQMTLHTAEVQYDTELDDVSVELCDYLHPFE
ncbi:MAG: HAMP domain-containing histidine kinase [Clostridia bacterium]|nr:HAMP domain-containing histidine kinase [Clostridia bacterium]